ncbi:hypothetical protein [Pseudonocardia sp.]|uniref:hypothetical protein n=1 Tax=Pseudonocardia sp. TaxID=60912 RepID=UPI003D10D1DD
MNPGYVMSMPPLQQPHPQDRAPFVPAQRTTEPSWHDAALPIVGSVPARPSGVTSGMSDRRGVGRAPMRHVAPTFHPARPARHGAGTVSRPVPAAPLVPPQRMAPGVPSPTVTGQRHPREEATVRDDAGAATTGLAAALDVVGRVGGAVTLAAVLVLAVAVGGAVDGRPASDSAPLTVTFEP